MKPKKINQADWEIIYNALQSKAHKLRGSKSANEMPHSNRFFSENYYPCVYEDRPLPRSFRVDEKEEVDELWHFINFSCECESAKMFTKHDMTNWPICLAAVTYENEDGSIREAYFLTTHRIGQCPWKTKAQKR